MAQCPILRTHVQIVFHDYNTYVTSAHLTLEMQSVACMGVARQPQAQVEAV